MTARSWILAARIAAAGFSTAFLAVPAQAQLFHCSVCGSTAHGSSYHDDYTQHRTDGQSSSSEDNPWQNALDSMRKSLEKGYENNKVAAKSELNQWLRETNARQEAMPSAKPAERLLDGVSPPGRRFDSALEQVVALYETGDFVGAATLARRWIDEDPTDKARVEILGRMAGVAIRHVNGFHSQAADELLAAEKHGTDAARQAADGSFGGLMKAKEMASWVWDKRRKSVGSVTLPAAATTPVSHTIVDWSATTRRILDAPLSPSTELAVREIRAANADKERAQAALGRLDSSDENQRPEIAKQNQVIVHATAKQATVVLALPHFTSWGIGTDGTPAAEKKDHSGTSTTNGHE